MIMMGTDSDLSSSVIVINGNRQLMISFKVTFYIRRYQFVSCWASMPRIFAAAMSEWSWFVGMPKGKYYLIGADGFVDDDG